ncbi:MAG: SIR2 family protein [Pyrinomonadaceae bacterium]|nr:SIR2 family protein [Pyrinomonadaceae bacterium]
MITNRIVLVLGAGASIPYGFPSGVALTNQIIKELKDKGGQYTNDILDCGFKWGLLNKFRQHLELSYQASIDAFLEHRTEFMKVGKTCIARSLIPCEAISNLARGREGHWYEYLFQKLSATPENFARNSLSIITFNYDRSLEHFLFIAIKHSYGISDSDTAKLVRTIPIIHLHGDLGKLTVLDGIGRPYEPTISPSILNQCATDIKIIYEDVTDDSQFVEAQKLIESAELVCFLGFGFHPMNINRLWVKSKDSRRPRKIYGTAYKMPNSEKSVVERRFIVSAESRYQEERIQLENCDSLRALQNLPILV